MSKMLKRIVVVLVLINLWIYEIKSVQWLCEDKKVGEWRRQVLCRWEGKPEVRDVSHWQKASVSARCSQNEPCQIQFQVGTSSEVSETSEFHMDVGAMIGTAGSLGVGISNSKTLSTGATRTETMTCNVAPGHEADVWVLIEQKHFKGRVIGDEEEWDLGITRPGTAFTRVHDYEVTVPTVDPSTGRLNGPMECRQRPLADVNDIQFVVNTRTMKEGCELDAANDALNNSVKKVPPKGLNVLSAGSSCGTTVHVRTMCFNLDDPNSYEAKCSSCIKYARANILSRGKNAYGMNWRLHDCSMRFEFYHFD